jgi:hypothetical protein
MKKQSAGAAGTDPEGSYVAYFGYGSLVNRATLRTDIVDIIPARLVGWRRIWRPRPDMPGFPAALLTVRREPGCVCDGVLIVDRAENLAAVDEREARYRRVRLEPLELEISPAREGAVAADVPAYVYEADPGLPPHREPPMILHPISTRSCRASLPCMERRAFAVSLPKRTDSPKPRSGLTGRTLHIRVPFRS